MHACFSKESTQHKIISNVCIFQSLFSPFRPNLRSAMHSFSYPCSYTIESYVHPPCLLTLSLPSKSLLTSSSVNRSCPVQLALDVLARNLCHLSLLLLNTSSMFSGPGCPNIVAGSIGSCLAMAFRRAGESVQLGASKFSSAESSSSESVWISGSSIFSPF